VRWRTSSVAVQMCLSQNRPNITDLFVQSVDPDTGAAEGGVIIPVDDAWQFADALTGLLDRANGRVRSPGLSGPGR
jgi:hypothetical protein